MKSHFARIGVSAAAGIAALALTAACSSSSSPSASGSAPTSATAPSSAGAPSSAASVGVMTTAAPGLGTILVDSTGRTIYRYDKDSNNPPTSNCSGGCAQAWPPVPATTNVTGVDSSLVGSITGSNGAKQLTIAGWPMYYYASDTAAGQTTGQGVGGVWWVVGANGAEIKASAGGASASAS